MDLKPEDYPPWLADLEFSEMGRDREHFPPGWYIIPAFLFALICLVGAVAAIFLA